MQIYRRAITNLTVVGVNYAGFIDVLNPPFDRYVPAAIEVKLK